MLKSYPPKINNTAIPFFKQWNISRAKNKQTYTRQNGVEVDVLTRQSQLTISASTTCLWETVAQFLPYQAATTLTVSLYTPNVGYTDYVMRMEDFSYSLVKDSEELTEVNGVYNMSFTLREF